LPPKRIRGRLGELSVLPQIQVVRTASNRTDWRDERETRPRV